MFQKKTVVVLGAGASAEAGLPTGQALTEQIAEILDFAGNRIDFHPVQRAAQIHGDETVREAIDLIANRFGTAQSGIAACRKSCQQICDAMPQADSIDAFLDAHRGDEPLELCGKLAIAEAILTAESESLLHFDPEHVRRAWMLDGLKSSWFSAFMQLLAENCTARELATRLATVSFVAFNYDRCVEHFLYNAIQNYYGVSASDASEIVGRVEVLHPYGSVGYLPWEGEEPSIDFGEAPSAEQLVRLSQQVRTFTEGTDPEASNVCAIRDRVNEAEILVFLGFAYHRQNLELLFSNAPEKRPGERRVECYGTAMGISLPDRQAIESELVRMLQDRAGGIRLRTVSCYRLFREYRRALALS